MLGPSKADYGVVRKEWNLYNYGRFPITAGEPKRSTTVQEDEEEKEAAENAAREAIEKDPDVDMEEISEGDAMEDVQ